MPDDSILNASRQLIDTGVLGAVLILVIAALIWVTRQWLNTQKELSAAKQEHLETVRESAARGVEIKIAMQANTTALQAVTMAVQTLTERRR